MTRWQKALLGIAGTIVLAAAVLVAFGGSITYFLMHVAPFMGESFTPEKWSAGGDCSGLSDWECEEKNGSCPRGPMVRSLVRNHLSPGTPKARVLELLGAPYDASAPEGDGCLNWSLGMCSGIGIDYDSLFVCFDPSENVIKAGHVQH